MTTCSHNGAQSQCCLKVYIHSVLIINHVLFRKSLNVKASVQFLKLWFMTNFPICILLSIKHESSTEHTKKDVALNACDENTADVFSVSFKCRNSHYQST